MEVQGKERTNVCARSPRIVDLKQEERRATEGRTRVGCWLFAVKLRTDDVNVRLMI